MKVLQMPINEAELDILEDILSKNKLGKEMFDKIKSSIVEVPLSWSKLTITKGGEA